jgi:hypothetical protein
VFDPLLIVEMVQTMFDKGENAIESANDDLFRRSHGVICTRWLIGLLKFDTEKQVIQK